MICRCCGTVMPDQAEKFVRLSQILLPRAGETVANELVIRDIVATVNALVRRDNQMRGNL